MSRPSPPRQLELSLTSIRILTKDPQKVVYIFPDPSKQFLGYISHHLEQLVGHLMTLIIDCTYLFGRFDSRVTNLVKDTAKTQVI